VSTSVHGAARPLYPRARNCLSDWLSTRLRRRPRSVHRPLEGERVEACGVPILESRLPIGRLIRADGRFFRSGVATTDDKSWSICGAERSQPTATAGKRINLAGRMATCYRLLLVASVCENSSMIRRGRRFESVRGLAEAKQTKTVRAGELRPFFSLCSAADRQDGVGEMRPGPPGAGCGRRPWGAQTRPRGESARFAGRSNKCTPTRSTTSREA
jgi:hypothetical protein